MELRLLAQLMFRVAGIVILLSMLENGAMLLLEYSRSSQEGGQSSIFLAVMCVMLIFSVVLIVFPGYLSSLVVPTETKAVKSADQQGGDSGLITAMLSLAVSLAGLYFLFSALSDLAYNLTHWLGTRSLNPVGYLSYWTVERLAGYIRILVELTAGSYFLFGGRGLVKLAGWARDVHPDVK